MDKNKTIEIDLGEEFLIFSKKVIPGEAEPVDLFSFEKFGSIEGDQIIWQSGKKTSKTDIQKIQNNLGGWKDPTALRLWKVFISTGKNTSIDLKDIPTWDISITLYHSKREVCMDIYVEEEIVPRICFLKEYKKPRTPKNADSLRLLLETNSMIDVLKFFIENPK